MKTIYITFVNYDEGQDYELYKAYDDKKEMDSETADNLQKFFKMGPDNLTTLEQASLNIPDDLYDLFINTTDFDNKCIEYIKEVYKTKDLNVLSVYTWDIVDYVAFSECIDKDDIYDINNYPVDEILENDDLMFDYICSILDEG